MIPFCAHAKVLIMPGFYLPMVEIEEKGEAHLPGVCQRTNLKSFEDEPPSTTTHDTPFAKKYARSVVGQTARTHLSEICRPGEVCLEKICAIKFWRTALNKYTRRDGLRMNDCFQLKDGRIRSTSTATREQNELFIKLSKKKEFASEVDPLEIYASPSS